ncbi:MAG: hypothetical protein JOS17DRAFT_759453 [Linnemannia elongata]|nr:MAG: hypothetical protein JOS17DRAFT_759453 [Linnemannia elongata]
MIQDTFQTITTATIGLGLAAMAYQNTKLPKILGRATWDDDKDVKDFDYVVLGGGTAGCVLASRLSEDPSVSVLVIEAGEDMDNSIQTKLPIGYPKLFQTKHDWQFKTIPQTHAEGREMDQVRGKMLGGCSSINAMQYTRGPHSDYDAWESEFGNDGWSYKSVLPYFKKAEGFHDPSLDKSHPMGPRSSRVHDPEYDTFEPEYHGTEGPWHQSYHHFSATTKAFIKTGVAMGLPHTPDPNGRSELGVARMQTSINADATRCSTSNAYLRPEVVPGGGARGHVRVVLKAHVERILLETKDGVPTAVGAEFRDDKDVLRRVYARREVLLSAGVFCSPALLLASGIGYHIHDSIPLLHHLPGVGENLSDHVGMSVVYACPPTTQTMHTAFAPSKLPKALYQYFVHGTGPLTSQVMEAACFVRLEDIAPDFVAREKANGTYQERASGPNAPHIEILFPACFVDNEDFTRMDDTHKNFYTLLVVLLNPASRGRTSARVTEVVVDQKKTTAKKNSKEGEAEMRFKVEPLIDPNFLADEFDIRVLREGMRFARRLGKKMQQDPALAGFEYVPGEASVPSEDDEAMDLYIRQKCTTFLHSVGTCSMGPATNPKAVVDERLKVHGVDRLRVVDASVMPKVIAGHTAAGTVMLAERAADLIKDDWAGKDVSAL